MNEKPFRLARVRPAITEILLGDGEVTVDDLLSVAMHGCPVRLSEDPAWRETIERGRRVLEDSLRQDRSVYGVSTGVGANSSRAVPSGARKDFSTFIVRQHGCGMGRPFPVEVARAVVFARVVGLAKGYSAVRHNLLEMLVELLNGRVAPVIPRWGSVGASGDLTPLSYLAAVMMGEREAYHEGEVLPAAEALQRAGLESLRLVMYGRSAAFHETAHRVKPHPGQIASAAAIRTYLEQSGMIDRADETGRIVQDTYSIRCAPHVLGAARDAATWMREVLHRELNSVNDNPIVDPDRGDVLCAGNFYGGHVALTMDLLKITAASVADLCDRQFALLVDSRFNLGLPETLVGYEGCGLKALQITASAITALAAQATASDTVLSRSTEAHNQDKVSMGLNAAVHASEVVTSLQRVLAVELIALSNAAACRDEAAISPAGRLLLAEIREYSPALTEDRRLDTDLDAIVGAIDGWAARAVEGGDGEHGR